MDVSHNSISFLLYTNRHQSLFEKSRNENNRVVFRLKPPQQKQSDRPKPKWVRSKESEGNPPSSTKASRRIKAVSRRYKKQLARESRAGGVEKVGELLERGVPIDHLYRDGFTPLMRAAFYGHRELAELYLTRPGVRLR